MGGGVQSAWFQHCLLLLIIPTPLIQSCHRWPGVKKTIFAQAVDPKDPPGWVLGASSKNVFRSIEVRIGNWKFLNEISHFLMIVPDPCLP